MSNHQKAASSFSFAPHESDPTDVAVHPAGHYAHGITTGAAAGSLAGAVGGAMLGHNFKTMIGRAGLGAIAGAGAGAGVGYHQVDTKRRAVEQAYGAQDPFALQKMSSENAYEMGRLFALRMIASQKQD